MPLFTADTPIEEMIVALHAKIDRLDNAANLVAGRGITSGELAKRFISALVSSKKFAVHTLHHWCNAISENLGQKDLCALAEVFKMQNFGQYSIATRKGDVLGFEVSTGEVLAPTRCTVVTPQGDGQKSDFTLELFPARADDNHDNLKRELQHVMGDDIHIELFLAKNYCRYYFLAPDRVGTYELGEEFGELTDIEAAFLACEMKKAIYNRMGGIARYHTYNDPQNQKAMQEYMVTFLAEDLAAANLELEIMHLDNLQMWFRLNSIGENGVIATGKALRTSRISEKKMRSYIRNIIKTPAAVSDLVIHPLFDAYLSKAYPGERDNIMAKAKTLNTETWNLAQPGRNHSDVWIKVVNGEVQGRFPLAPGIAWAYDRITMRKSFMAKIPEGVRLGLSEMIKPGDRLDRYIDLSAIPGMEKVCITKVNTRKDSLSLSLDLKAA